VSRSAAEAILDVTPGRRLGGPHVRPGGTSGRLDVASEQRLKDSRCSFDSSIRPGSRSVATMPWFRMSFGTPSVCSRNRFPEAWTMDR